MRENKSDTEDYTDKSLMISIIIVAFQKGIS